MLIKVYIFRTSLPLNTIRTKKLCYHLQNEEDDTSASDDEENRPVLHLPLVASVKLDDDTGTGSLDFIILTLLVIYTLWTLNIPLPTKTKSMHTPTFIHKQNSFKKLILIKIPKLRQGIIVHQYVLKNVQNIWLIGGQ